MVVSSRSFNSIHYGLQFVHGLVASSCGVFCFEGRTNCWHVTQGLQSTAAFARNGEHRQSAIHGFVCLPIMKSAPGLSSVPSAAPHLPPPPTPHLRRTAGLAGWSSGRQVTRTGFAGPVPELGYIHAADPPEHGFQSANGHIPRCGLASLLEGFRAQQVCPIAKTPSPTTTAWSCLDAGRVPQFWVCDVAGATGWLHLSVGVHGRPVTAAAFDSCNLGRPIDKSAVKRPH